MAKKVKQKSVETKVDEMPKDNADTVEIKSIESSSKKSDYYNHPKFSKFKKTGAEK